MKYYIIAGESSGDQHAAYLIRSLKNIDPESAFRFWGGERMAAVSGSAPEKHIDELAFMGFWEVFINLRSILRNFRQVKADILNFKPDCLILVDYPGFNLRMAEWAHKKGIKVAYFIAPQVWAWKENRVSKIQKYCDLLLTILPFEETYFHEKGVEQAKFVGHPLLDHFSEFQADQTGFEALPKLFGIFPGSRLQEVRHILPPVSPIFHKNPDIQFGLSATPKLMEEPRLYSRFTKGAKNVNLFRGRQHDLLANCYAAFVKSGTSTLEAALLGVPQAVIYKGNPISFQIAKRVVKVPYISLVNLILDENLVDEHIQSEVNPKVLERAFEKLQDDRERQRIREGYNRLREKLGGPGASDRAAREIFKLIT
ncbi:MAG: lipid-A-disaccharide synthase [Saprospirales bacterium]|nr:MAG: lipid-A-disaccharide synthase [Saprospirales bacterium]